jgi:hypothetical protein
MFFAKYNSNDQVKEDEMDRVCSIQGDEGICDFGAKSRRKQTTEKIILKWILSK